LAENKLTYWLATTEFPPIHGGGISTYCWHTAKMMEENGHEVTVIIFDHEAKGIETNKISENITVVRFDPDESKIKDTLGFEALLSYEFANVIEHLISEKGKPDILEFQDYLGIGYYTLQKKQLLYEAFIDLKIVVTLHAPVFLYYEYNQVPMYQFPEYWICEMEKSSIRQADLVISPSNYLIKELDSRMILDDVNLKQIFNPFKNEWSDGEIAKYEQNDLVFFGKLTPQKGAIELLSYFQNLWDNGFEKRLTIIGGGKHFFYPFNEDLLDLIQRKYAKFIEKG